MDSLNRDLDLIEDLGKYLQQKREEQGISLKALASRTRIPIRFVEAMEVNHFDDLPNPVSTKGFLRSYAEFIGVDYTRILEAFSKLDLPSGSFSPTENHDKILSYLHVKKTSRFPFPRRVAFSVGGVIILLLALVGLLPKKKVALKSPSSLPAFSVAPPQRQKIPSPGVLALEPSLELPIEEKNGVKNLEKNASTAAEGLPVDETGSETKEKLAVLSIEAVEPSWVQVTIDDLEMREALLQPNDSVTWEAKEKFLLKLGNAGGVKVLLDGRELGPFGPSGEVVSREIRITETDLEESE